MKSRYYSFFFFLLLIIACQKPSDSGFLKPQPQYRQFQVNKKSITLAGDLNLKDSFSVQSNVNWSVAVFPAATTWLKLNVDSGSGDGKVVVTGVEKNPINTSRTATVRVTPADTSLQPLSIVVTQKALSPYLTVDSTSLTFRSPQAATDSFSIISNLQWSLMDMPYWLSAKTTTGTGNGKIYINALANDSGLYRTAVLKVTPVDSAGAKAKLIKVTQGTPVLKTDKGSLNVEASAGSADSFRVISNIDWTTTATASWLTLKTVKAGADTYVVATATESNTSDVSRTATITLTAAGVPNVASVKVVVTQAKAPVTTPTVSTASISSIGGNTATGGGEVLSDGGFAVTVRGICWSTAANPTIAHSKTSNGAGKGSFTSAITGLAPNTTYYVRAYATNSSGTTYGKQVSFKTSAVTVPTVKLISVLYDPVTSAIAYGQVVSDGGAAVKQRGFCWSTAPNPTLADQKVGSGTGTGSYSGNLAVFAPNTTYYVRAYATNRQGTVYSNEISFKTP